MAVVLVVVSLVVCKRGRIINFDQRVAAPACSVGLNVTDTFLHAAPVATFRERLQSHTPRLIEVALADSTPVLEPLHVELSHGVPSSHVEVIRDDQPELRGLLDVKIGGFPPLRVLSMRLAA